MGHYKYDDLMEKYGEPKANGEKNINAKLSSKINILLYSDAILKGGLNISYSNFLSALSELSLNLEGVIIEKENDEVIKQFRAQGFVNGVGSVYFIIKESSFIFVTDRGLNTKYRYCVRVMDKKLSKVNKREFVNDLNEVKDIDIALSNENKFSQFKITKNVNINVDEISIEKTNVYNYCIVNTIANVRKIKNAAVSMFQKGITKFIKLFKKSDK